jgi:hypothetical protein
VRAHAAGKRRPILPAIALKGETTATYRFNLEKWKPGSRSRRLTMTSRAKRKNESEGDGVLIRSGRGMATLGRAAIPPFKEGNYKEEIGSKESRL